MQLQLVQKATKLFATAQQLARFLPAVPLCAAADVCCFRARHSSANENLDFAQDLVVVVDDVVSVLLRLRCATPLIDQCRDSLWLEFEL